MAFPTTHWTQLAEATLHGDASGQEALAAMCHAYRKPVEAFMAARGYRDEELEDLVQEFFLRWLKSRAWKRADPMRGRFRSYLLGAVQHLLAHQRDYEGRQKRGGGRPEQSLDALLEKGFEPPDLSDPAVSEFDRQWAVAVVENALGRVEEEFRQAGRTAEFAVLRRFLPGSAAALTMEQAGAALNLSQPAIKAAIHRLRLRFRGTLRSAVAQTVGSMEEVAEEMQYLRTLLSGERDRPEGQGGGMA
jgi:DNA-directed RNA polymerase specialized sigma24 family protein